MGRSVVRSGEVDDMIKYFDHEGFVSYGDVTYIDLTCFRIEKEFVLRRSDGTSLYSTRDLAYHRYKATQGDDGFRYFRFRPQISSSTD